MTDDTAFRYRVRAAEILWRGGFYYCPTTDLILEALEGDDKVLCPCRRSNPKVLAERAERTGVHIVRFLTPATPEDYVRQEDARRAAERRAAEQA